MKRNSFDFEGVALFCSMPTASRCRESSDPHKALSSLDTKPQAILTM